ncbi:hypothetical protein PR048_006149 [Dryococelus australis]|uniref:Uncharacterized protein n=1 Tax=Dryococelus australis TaxID=614101 RepID=A0ABQ9IA86_9NEOP|nr:hypothetical protein PR048_006149 [Dryococelus australis]
MTFRRMGPTKLDLTKWEVWPPPYPPPTSLCLKPLAGCCCRSQHAPILCHEEHLIIFAPRISTLCNGNWHAARQCRAPSLHKEAILVILQPSLCIHGYLLLIFTARVRQAAVRSPDDGGISRPIERLTAGRYSLNLNPVPTTDILGMRQARVNDLKIVRYCSGWNKTPVSNLPSVSLFACGNRAGRCRWSAGFLGDLPFPRPFTPGCSILTSITSVNSPDFAVKSRPNLFTHSRVEKGVAARTHLEPQHVRRQRVYRGSWGVWGREGQLAGLARRLRARELACRGWDEEEGGMFWEAAAGRVPTPSHEEGARLDPLPNPLRTPFSSPRFGSSSRRRPAARHHPPPPSLPILHQSSHATEPLQVPTLLSSLLFFTAFYTHTLHFHNPSLSLSLFISFSAPRRAGRLQPAMVCCRSPSPTKPKRTHCASQQQKPGLRRTCKHDGKKMPRNEKQSPRQQRRFQRGRDTASSLPDNKKVQAPVSYHGSTCAEGFSPSLDNALWSGATSLARRPPTAVGGAQPRRHAHQDGDAFTYTQYQEYEDMSSLPSVRCIDLRASGDTSHFEPLAVQQRLMAAPLRRKLHREEGLGKESAMVYVCDPSQHSPGVIWENYGKPKSGWPDRESNHAKPCECTASEEIKWLEKKVPLEIPRPVETATKFSPLENPGRPLRKSNTDYIGIRRTVNSREYASQ